MDKSMTPQSVELRSERAEITVNLRLAVEIHEDETGGYWGACPELPGCISEGDTREEILANLAEAARAWLGPRPVLGFTPRSVAD